MFRPSGLREVDVGDDVQAQNCAREGGSAVLPETTYARIYALNAHEQPRHTWEGNLISTRIDALAQQGALSRSRPVVRPQRPGVVQQLYLLTRRKAAGLQQRDGGKGSAPSAPPPSVSPAPPSHQPLDLRAPVRRLSSTSGSCSSIGRPPVRA